MRRFNATVIACAAIALLAGLVFATPVEADGYQHGITINVDGEDYNLDGAPDGPNGAFDIPGREWSMASANQLVGKHYNTAPLAPQASGQVAKMTVRSYTR